MLMPKACQPQPPRPTQNAAPATRSGAKRCPARSDCRQLQPARQHLGTSSLSYVSAKCLGSGSHDIPGISYYGQLGNGTTNGYSPNPTPINVASNVVDRKSTRLNSSHLGI